jgi:hypothetical protein
LPSVPMKHIPSYPLIAPRVPVPAKNLPSQPRESPPTTNPPTPAHEQVTRPPVQPRALSQAPHVHGNRHLRQAADFDTIYDAYSHNFSDVSEPRTAPATEKPLQKAPEPVNRTERLPAGPQILDSHANVSFLVTYFVSVALVSIQQRSMRDRS